MVKVIITAFAITLSVAIIVVFSTTGFRFSTKGETETMRDYELGDEQNTNQIQETTPMSNDIQEQHAKSFLGLDHLLDNQQQDFRRRTKEPKADLRCGQPAIVYDSRIVGGKEASIVEFPWMISLQKEKRFWFGFKAFYHSCGGSLITPSWILTAAHCVYSKEPMIRAVAGADNMNLLYRAQLRSVSKTVMHPDFDITTYNNDIALIKVSRPFNLESTFSHVGAICFEREVNIEPYDIATIAGFGANSFKQQSQAHLYKTEIAIIDQRTCNESFDLRITENMICAGGMISHKRDACTGDSGGPLELEVDDHKTLIGVVSFGNKCASQGYPGVYTKIHNYYDWVLGILDEPLIKT